MLTNEKVVAIHTSDMALYLACRRRWLWGSFLNRGLEPTTKAAPLWFGEAFHHALKDFHGPRHFPSAVESFYDFVKDSWEHHHHRLPADAAELVKLGYRMFEHYDTWLERRDPLTTYEFEGRLQVESGFEIELPIDQTLLDRLNIDRVVYRGTFDRVTIDENGHLWVLDYKTAKRIETGHLLNDPQISAYMWAASCIYDRPVIGFIYQQHRKDTPKDPRILKNGHLSTAKDQLTTHKRYKETLQCLYGKKESSWSEKHIEVLNKLAYEETEDKDSYIQRNKVERNQHFIASTGAKILDIVHEMINPDTRIFPHQSRNCSMCQFQSPCVSMDDGSDYEHELRNTDLYVTREKASSEWELLSFSKLGGILYRAKALAGSIEGSEDYVRSERQDSLSNVDPDGNSADDSGEYTNEFLNV